ncbi:hypothetical protein HCN44_005713 [Aphidius gifuensis]|uniref:Tubulin glycylase 3A n=1 Tax=Aphidius gifuensis TaxID=684658 RepID=A0A834XWN0_APHGI|nr:hypothetical protein HCN44_005713 [Aphidius gifuensis]
MIENMTMLKEDEKKMINNLTINSKTNDIDDVNDNPDDLVVVARLETPISSTLQERFLSIKEIVKRSILQHHTFMIYGRAKIIRECLLKRGWIEKLNRRNRLTNQQTMGIDTSPVILLSGVGDLKDEQSQRLLMSKMLSNYTVDLLWNSGSDWPGWPSQDNKKTIFNRFTRAAFTSKIGLCTNVRQMHWFYEPGIANTLFPRCYNICQADHMHAFIEDFRMTACLSLLKWFVDKINNEGENTIISSTGTVPLKMMDFAIKRCSDYIEALLHEDIDKDGERVWQHQWDQFISCYYKIIQNDELFISINTSLNKYHQASKHILKRMRIYWQQLDMDGIQNIWILKPGNKSRGRGIVLVNKIEDVIAKINPANKSDTRFVVQKYIEKPLLIYNTKFDIRQWFIVTCAQPLTLWMYRESYLRFCTQNFQLADLHESIHLCNNAIQCKYKNSTDRHPALPIDNMWDSTTFKQFLDTQGHTNVWDELIYPGMKQGLVGSLLASQEAMDRRKNSFELYGADFMIMDDFTVWLIEINSHPDMSNSTSVTTRLCKQVMEDTIKVVVDYREDKNSDTGLFELIYKQKIPNCQPYLGTALSVQGQKITTNDKKLYIDSKTVPKLPMSCLPKKKLNANSYIGPVIVDLIEELEIQLDRELQTYCKLESPDDSVNSSPVISSSISPQSTSLKIDKNQLTTNGINGIASSTKSPEPSRKNSSKIIKLKKVNDVQQKNSIKKIKNRREIAKTAGELRTDSLIKNKISSEEKLISLAMKNAMNKYKIYGTSSIEVPALPSLIVPSKSISRVTRSSSLSNNKIRQKSKIKKVKDSSVVDDIYAVGLGITK